VVAAEAHEVDGRVKFRSIEAEFKLDGDVEPLGEVVALFGVIGVPRAAGPLEEPVDDADDDG
jgi:hypothetical protein